MVDDISINDVCSLDNKKLVNKKIKSKVAKFSIKNWGQSPLKIIKTKMLDALESGRVVSFPELGFSLSQDEKRMINSDLSLCGCKKIVYKPKIGELDGVPLIGDVDCLDNKLINDSGELCVKKSEAKFIAKKHLNAILKRFSDTTQDFLNSSFPKYAGKFELGDASFIANKKLYNLDLNKSELSKNTDQLLHIDAFATKPVNDKRILRIYTNIGKDGDDKQWSIGDDFCSIIKRFAPQVPRPMLFSRTLMKLFRRTNKSRSLYDHYMLSISKLMQKDKKYQQEVITEKVVFPSGSSWMSFSDQVSYGVLSGHNVLEQVVYLPVCVMKNPDKSPLKMLQKFYGRSILDI